MKSEYYILLLIVFWGFIIAVYRSRFRKMVYRTTDWKINIKPVFLKEVKALLGNIYPYDKNYIRIRNIYRFQLIIFVVLFISYQLVNKSRNDFTNNKTNIKNAESELIYENKNNKLEK